MPIQKPKSFFVNVIGSETNRRVLIGFTTHRTSPRSSGFSLRGARDRSLRSEATGAPAVGEVPSRGVRFTPSWEHGHAEKLRDEQVQIEIDNASELKKFPLELSHAGFVFRGHLSSERYQ
jgi:hypothetical protein